MATPLTMIVVPLTNPQAPSTDAALAAQKRRTAMASTIAVAGPVYHGLVSAAA
jgi:hypothetical protein